MPRPSNGVEESAAGTSEGTPSDRPKYPWIRVLLFVSIPGIVLSYGASHFGTPSIFTAATALVLAGMIAVDGLPNVPRWPFRRMAAWMIVSLYLAIPLLHAASAGGILYVDLGRNQLRYQALPYCLEFAAPANLPELDCRGQKQSSRIEYLAMFKFVPLIPQTWRDGGNRPLQASMRVFARWNEVVDLFGATEAAKLYCLITDKENAERFQQCLLVSLLIDLKDCNDFVPRQWYTDHQELFALRSESQMTCAPYQAARELMERTCPQKISDETQRFLRLIQVEAFWKCGVAKSDSRKATLQNHRLPGTETDDESAVRT